MASKSTAADAAPDDNFATPSEADEPEVTAAADQPNADAVNPDEVAPEAADNVELLEFPSLADEPDVEVAKRSADVHEAASNQHVKIYVLGPGTFEDAANFDHSGNIIATRQAMIAQGMRPAGDVVFVGANVAKDGVSIELAYVVDAVPAAVATDPDVAHAKATQD